MRNRRVEILSRQSDLGQVKQRSRVLWIELDCGIESFFSIVGFAGFVFSQTAVIKQVRVGRGVFARRRRDQQRQGPIELLRHHITFCQGVGRVLVFLIGAALQVEGLLQIL